mgnify:CR=1 FL=1
MIRLLDLVHHVNGRQYMHDSKDSICQIPCIDAIKTSTPLIVMEIKLRKYTSQNGHAVQRDNDYVVRSKSGIQWASTGLFVNADFVSSNSIQTFLDASSNHSRHHGDSVPFL